MDWAFIKHYFIKLGCLDGWAGFVIAFGNMEGSFWRHAKCHELTQGTGARPGRTRSPALRGDEPHPGACCALCGTRPVPNGHEQPFAAGERDRTHARGHLRPLAQCREESLRGGRGPGVPPLGGAPRGVARLRGNRERGAPLLSPAPAKAPGYPLYRTLCGNPDASSSPRPAPSTSAAPDWAAGKAIPPRRAWCLCSSTRCDVWDRGSSSDCGGWPPGSQTSS